MAWADAYAGKTALETPTSIMINQFRRIPGPFAMALHHARKSYANPIRRIGVKRDVRGSILMLDIGRYL